MKNHQLDLPCHSSSQQSSDISPLYRLSSDIQSQTLYTSGPTLCLSVCPLKFFTGGGGGLYLLVGKVWGTKIEMEVQEF